MLIDTNCIPLSIQLLNESNRKAVSKLGVFDKNGLVRCEFVKVSATIPLASYAGFYNPAYDIKTNVALIIATARTELCKRISDLLIFANIARLGSIELRASAVFQDGKVESSDIPKMDGFAAQSASTVAEKMQWPPLTPMKLTQILEWSQTAHEMIDGFSKSPVSRALSAFSRLFEKKSVNEPMQLLWALVGIESLYVRGESGLSQQVREKSQALLGSQESYKKVLSRMYNFRSRFVHGNLGFPSLSFFHSGNMPPERYNDELLEAVSVAIAVLAATIQEIIRRGWSGLDFLYTAHPPEE